MLLLGLYHHPCFSQGVSRVVSEVSFLSTVADKRFPADCLATFTGQRPFIGLNRDFHPSWVRNYLQGVPAYSEIFSVHIAVHTLHRLFLSPQS